MNRNPHHDQGPDPDDSTAEGSLSAVIAAYLQAVDAGQRPDRDELLSRHRDIADDLRRSSPIRIALNGSPAHSVKPPSIPTPPSRRRFALGAHVSYFGDYELRGEIGPRRDGRGVSRRQVSLERTVALR